MMTVSGSSSYVLFRIVSLSFALIMVTSTYYLVVAALAHARDPEVSTFKSGQRRLQAWCSEDLRLSEREQNRKSISGISEVLQFIAEEIKTEYGLWSEHHTCTHAFQTFLPERVQCSWSEFENRSSPTYSLVKKHPSFNKEILERVSNETKRKPELVGCMSTGFEWWNVNENSNCGVRNTKDQHMIRFYQIHGVWVNLKT